MILYLAGSTRLDIAYAVHQCARLLNKPILSHEVGLKHIGRYLKGAKIMGIIMRPDTAHMNMNLFADGDFAGSFAA